MNFYLYSFGEPNTKQLMNKRPYFSLRIRTNLSYLNHRKRRLEVLSKVGDNVSDQRVVIKPLHLLHDADNLRLQAVSK